MSNTLSALVDWPSTSYNEYELEGIKVQDATGGKVEPKLSGFDPDTGRKVYKILIKGHEIFAPNGAFSLTASGSKNLTFEEKNGYIHIIKTENGEVSRLYVDAQKVNSLKQKERLFFSYQETCLMTQQQLEQRLKTYKENYFEIAKDIQIVAHNKHGVVVAGLAKVSDRPFQDSEKMPFVAISHGNDENWHFYMGRDFGEYKIVNQADTRVKTMEFTSLRGTPLKVHHSYNKDTHEEKITINFEEAEKIVPEWMNIKTV